VVPHRGLPRCSNGHITQDSQKTESTVLRAHSDLAVAHLLWHTFGMAPCVRSCVPVPCCNISSPFISYAYRGLSTYPEKSTGTSSFWSLPGQLRSANVERSHQACKSLRHMLEHKHRSRFLYRQEGYEQTWLTSIITRALQVHKSR
jgi:hypothetical protein